MGRREIHLIRCSHGSNEYWIDLIDDYGNGMDDFVYISWYF